MPNDLNEVRGMLAPIAGGDQLLPMPRNPAAPADWAQNAVRHAASELARIIALPRRAMEQGITTEEAIPWAGQVALSGAGSGAPMAAPGAAGIFGGRLKSLFGGAKDAPEAAPIAAAVKEVAPVAPIEYAPLSGSTAEMSGRLVKALQSKDLNEFPALYKSLADKPFPELKELAKEFYAGGSPQSKKQALEQIWMRWRKLQEFSTNNSATRASF